MAEVSKKGAPHFSASATPSSVATSRSSSRSHLLPTTVPFEERGERELEGMEEREKREERDEREREDRRAERSEKRSEVGEQERRRGGAAGFKKAGSPSPHLRPPLLSSMRHSQTTIARSRAEPTLRIFRILSSRGLPFSESLHKNNDECLRQLLETGAGRDGVDEYEGVLCVVVGEEVRAEDRKQKKTPLTRSSRLFLYAER